MRAGTERDGNTQQRSREAEGATAIDG